MIEINNLTNFAVDRKSFAQVAKKVLLGENREIPTKSRTHDKIGAETLSLAFVDKEEIKKLNKKFRKKNKATDVLSFALKDGKFLGEIVICPEVVKDNAKKYGITAKKEMMKVFVHGILHLCGYDHEKSKKEAEIMGKKQERYLNELL